MRYLYSVLTIGTILFSLVLFPACPSFSQSLDDVVESHDSKGQPVVGQPSDSKEPPATDAPAGSGGDVESMRSKIVKLARAEIGEVSASKGDGDLKVGWERFLQYYQVAYKLNDIEKDRPHWVKTLKAPGKKINEWCGIFATWAWRTSGMPAYWNTRVVGCKYRSDVKNIQAGDICIVKKSLNPWNHHFLVASRLDDSIDTIDGNQSNQQILPHTRKITDVELFYSVADGLGTPLPPAKNDDKKSPGNPPSGKKDPGTTPPTGDPANKKALDNFMKELKEIIDSLFNLFK